MTKYHDLFSDYRGGGGAPRNGNSVGLPAVVSYMGHVWDTLNMYHKWIAGRYQHPLMMLKVIFYRNWWVSIIFRPPQVDALDYYCPWLGDHFLPLWGCICNQARPQQGACVITGRRMVLYHMEGPHSKKKTTTLHPLFVLAANGQRLMVTGTRWSTLWCTTCLGQWGGGALGP